MDVDVSVCICMRMCVCVCVRACVCVSSHCGERVKEKRNWRGRKNSKKETKQFEREVIMQYHGLYPQSQ